MTHIIFEQVFKGELSSFFYRRGRLWYRDEFPYHQHPEYEITFVFDGNGQRITDDFIEPFLEGEVVILPPDLPHGWVYDPVLCAPDGIIENATWQFSKEFLHQLSDNFPEFQTTVSFFEELRQAIEITGETAHKVRRILSDFNHYSESEQLLALWRVLDLAAHSSEYQYIGTKVFSGTKIHKNKRRLHTIYKYIVENYHRKISLDEISTLASMSKTAFCLFFKKATSESFTVYLNMYRLQVASKMLCRSTQTVSEICYAVGFSDVPYFNRSFKQRYGMSPTQYRNNFANT